jgi:hypothetical protein
LNSSNPLLKKIVLERINGSNPDLFHKWMINEDRKRINKVNRSEYKKRKLFENKK